MAKTKQIDAKALQAVVDALKDLSGKGIKLTDSEMFKYTNAYTGDVWEEKKGEVKKAA